MPLVAAVQADWVVRVHAAQAPTPSGAAPRDERSVFPLREHEQVLAGVAALSLLGAAVIVWATGGYGAAMAVATILAIAAAISAIHRRVRLSLASRLAVIAWSAAYLLGWIVPLGWPLRLLRNGWVFPGIFTIDQCLHVVAGAIATWVCWQWLHWRFRGHIDPGDAPRPTAGIIVLAGLVALGLGALYELLQFATVGLQQPPHGGGFESAGWNQTLDLIGILTAALIIGRRSAEPRPDVRSE